eukprot:TRINITY_DN2596_c0_g1_i1.p1 TRINITY_DN2596_c0_g1~~TRINITY_DN2596_c0_g1_i1.p1  ORF type:complete len:462 (-),score=139.20 TRINITY_DN2596_c0_g1_i1:151-1458(-)
MGKSDNSYRALPGAPTSSINHHPTDPSEEAIDHERQGEAEFSKTQSYPEEDVPELLRREIICVTLSVFMGYAILVSFQHKLKDKMGILDGDKDLSREFSFAVSFLYIGNLIFRLLHNAVFTCLTPRSRVYVSMCSMICSMFFLGFFVFVQGSTAIVWVYLAYGLGGVSVGSFESNLLSCITPLGGATKVWAIVGLPAGFACITVGGFILTALGVKPVVIYFIVIIALIMGVAVFFFRIPIVPIKKNADSFSAFVSNLGEWRQWATKLPWHASALTIDMLSVSLFSGVMLYIFNDGKEIPLWGPNSTTIVSHDWFFVVHNLFTLLGDSLSRKIVYVFPLRHPYLYLIPSFIGAALCLSKIAFVAPLGIFLVFFANGSIYATSTRYIDTHIKHEFNLISLSFWLFIGDVGSVIGSNVLPSIRDLVCTSASHYMCEKN